MHQVTLKILDPDHKGIITFGQTDFGSEIFYVDGQAVVVSYRPMTQVFHPIPKDKILGRE
jgi:hypothetical protein